MTKGDSDKSDSANTPDTATSTNCHKPLRLPLSLMPRGYIGFTITNPPQLVHTPCSPFRPPLSLRPPFVLS